MNNLMNKIPMASSIKTEVHKYCKLTLKAKE